jgi:Holliday junction resolvase
VDKAQAGRTGRARGTQRERAVAARLRDEGWVVGSMRTSAGGGDLIASKRSGRGAWVRLVEVKSTSRPFERFGPTDRLAMKAVAERAGATAWLAHWPKGGELRWIPESEWP